VQARILLQLLLSNIADVRGAFAAL
jgi:hypothetical protein